MLYSYIFARYMITLAKHFLATMRPYTHRNRTVRITQTPDIPAQHPVLEVTNGLLQAHVLHVGGQRGPMHILTRARCVERPHCVAACLVA